MFKEFMLHVIVQGIILTPFLIFLYASVKRAALKVFVFTLPVFLLTAALSYPFLFTNSGDYDFGSVLSGFSNLFQNQENFVGLGVYIIVFVLYWCATLFVWWIMSFLVDKAIDKIFAKFHIGKKDEESEKVTIYEDIKLDGLIPNREYTLESELINGDTGEDILIYDENMKITKTFTAKAENKTTDICFLCDKDYLETLKKKNATFLVTLYLDGEKVQTKEHLLWAIKKTFSPIPPQTTYFPPQEEHKNSEEPNRLKAPKETQKAENKIENNAENTQIQ